MFLLQLSVESMCLDNTGHSIGDQKHVYVEQTPKCKLEDFHICSTPL